MKFGIMASHQYPFDEDLQARLGELWGTAEHAASLGFDSIWVINHFVSNLNTPQPISMMAKLLQHTGQMTVGTGILLLPFFHPVHIAEEFATLDQLSGGRVVLGVAAGYREHEFEAFNVPMEERFSRLDEGVRVIRELWKGEPVTFEGKHFQLDDVRIGVRPYQDGGPPIWIGAGGKKAIRRAARLADAWYAPGNSPNPTFLEKHMAVYDDALAEYGRTDQIVERPVGTELYVSDTTERAIEEALPHARREYSTYAEYPALRWQRDRFDELVANTLILGDPDLVIERIKGLQAQGCNHLIFRPGWLGMPAEQVRRSLSLFAEHVMPAFR